MRADYLEMSVTSIAGTNGNGAVTMSRITNTPTFDESFNTSSLTRTVEYVIEDTSRLCFERGIGTVTGNVLTRGSPKTTWDQTTLNQNNPTAFAFLASGSAGNIRVRCSPTMASAAPTYPGVMQGVSPVNLNLGHHTSAHISMNAIQSSTTVVTGTEYYLPYLWEGNGAITSFAIWLQTAQTGAAVKVGIYETQTDGTPGNCITHCNAGAISLSSGSGALVTSAITTANNWSVESPNIAPGWYYIGLVFTATTTFPTIGHHAIGSMVRMSPIGWGANYGAAQVLLATASVNYATGLPTGIPGRTYLITNSQTSTSGRQYLVGLKPRI